MYRSKRPVAVLIWILTVATGIAAARPASAVVGPRTGRGGRNRTVTASAVSVGVVHRPVVRAVGLRAESPSL